MLEVVFERTNSAYELVRSSAVNRFVEIPAGSLFPTPDNRYRVCWYSLKPGETLVVRGRRPQARYFGLSLCNSWLESFDYLRHPVNLNHEQITFDEEGEFEVRVAGSRPSSGDWLDTAGHEEGALLARYLLPEDGVPELSVRVEGA